MDNLISKYKKDVLELYTMSNPSKNDMSSCPQCGKLIYEKDGCPTNYHLESCPIANNY